MVWYWNRSLKNDCICCCKHKKLIIHIRLLLERTRIKLENEAFPCYMDYSSRRGQRLGKYEEWWCGSRDCSLLLVSCTLPSLPSSVPSFCVDGFFVIVIVNVVGSRTITAIETDDIVGTKTDLRKPCVCDHSISSCFGLRSMCERAFANGLV